MAPAQLELFKFSLCKSNTPLFNPPQVVPQLTLDGTPRLDSPPDVFLPVYAMLHYGDPEWYEKWVGPLRSGFRRDDAKQVSLPFPSLPPLPDKPRYSPRTHARTHARRWNLLGTRAN